MTDAAADGAMRVADLRGRLSCAVRADSLIDEQLLAFVERMRGQGKWAFFVAVALVLAGSLIFLSGLAYLMFTETVRWDAAAVTAAGTAVTAMLSGGAFMFNNATQNRIRRVMGLLAVIATLDEVFAQIDKLESDAEKVAMMKDLLKILSMPAEAKPGS
ncbi:MAG: hypothetical protein AAF235_10765 [Planctomycetota bacterium]